MTNEEFEQVYYPRYTAVIRAIARKLAQKNDALMEDLVSEGMIALWKVDPSKAKDNPDAFIRQAIKFRMIDWIRKERPEMSESLTPYLERGDQVVHDADTNQARLVRIRELQRHGFLDDEDYARTGRLEDAVEKASEANPEE